MKKIVCIFLSFIICLTCVFILPPSVYAEQTQVEKIVNFAKSKIGSTNYVGLCQAFVYDCYKAAGIDNGSASSAIAAWKKWGVSTSKTNIPIGACVYFNENVGSKYGHVGIYIGNNKMIHSRQSVGKVVESSMTWYFENCYLGWGWQGGVEPSNSTQNSSSNTTNDIYKLTSPDGYQTVRSSDSTSSSAVTTIPTGTYVTVTKYNSAKTWGYVTYNGKSGWIRLYYVEKHSHSYGSWSTTKAATCTSSGTKTRKCSCSETQTESIAALGHNYSSSYTVDKAATCTAKGSKSKHCSRCSSTTSVTEIAATGHSYGSWTVTKEATCTQTGTKTRKCSSCSNTDTETISAKGHDYSTAWTVDKASTCTVAGSKSHHCSRCDAKTDISTVSAIGHTWSEWSVTKEATTESVGEKVRTCTRSGCTEKEKATIAKLAADGHTHDFGDWKIITEATCVSDGTEQRECSVCKEIESMTVTAKGHTFSDWKTTTEATADTNGLIERTCDICGEKESEEVLKTGVDSAKNSISDDGKNEKIIKTKEGINIWFLIIAVVSLSTLIVICIMLYKKKK